MSDAEGFIDDGFEGVKSSQIDGKHFYARSSASVFSDEFVYNELEDVPSNLTMVDLDDSFENVDVTEGLSKSVRFATPQGSIISFSYVFIRNSSE